MYEWTQYQTALFLVVYLFLRYATQNVGVHNTAKVKSIFYMVTLTLLLPTRRPHKVSVLVRIRVIIVTATSGIFVTQFSGSEDRYVIFHRLALTVIAVHETNIKDLHAMRSNWMRYISCRPCLKIYCQQLLCTATFKRSFAQLSKHNNKVNLSERLLLNLMVIILAAIELTHLFIINFFFFFWLVIVYKKKINPE